MFDILIIGAGVVGSAIARELARYQVKVAVLEKENDVCEESSKANSAIVHSGYDPLPGTLKAKLNVEGNKLFDQLSQELDFEFERIGSLTVAKNKEELAVLEELVKRGQENGVFTRIVKDEELKEMEPFLVDEAIAALYAPTAGIVNPFEYNVALMENAMDNGVQLFLNNKVISINKKKDYYEVLTNKATYKAKVVVNAAGLYSGEIAKMIGNDSIKITPYKGEYYVLDHFERPFVKHTIFPPPSQVGKGILVSPTTHGNYLLGPNSVETVPEDKSTTAAGLASIREGAQSLVQKILFQEVIRSFAGLRAKDISDDFVIKEDEKNRYFFHVAGIQSPGLVSSPAIAKLVVSLIGKSLKLESNPNFNPYRRPLIRLKKMPLEEVEKLIAKDPRFGRIICRCEKISEGEIVDVIHRNCGARTVKGIKKRIRPGFGKCQGGFCEPLCVKILARELGLNALDIRYGTKDSYILVRPSKEEEHEKG